MTRKELLAEIRRAQNYFDLGALPDEPRIPGGKVKLRELGYVLESASDCDEPTAIAKIHEGLLSGDLKSETTSATPIPPSSWRIQGEHTQGSNWFYTVVQQNAVRGFNWELPVVLIDDALDWLSGETARPKGRPTKIPAATAMIIEVWGSNGPPKGITQKTMLARIRDRFQDLNGIGERTFSRARKTLEVGQKD